MFSKTLIIGGKRVVIHSGDEVFLNQFVSPFIHLITLDDSDQLCEGNRDEISLVIGLRQQFAQKNLVLWPWDLNLYEDVSGVIQFDSYFNLIRGHNYPDKQFVYVFDTLDESLWIRPEYSRPIIELIFSRMNLASVHGGTLGRDGKCVLITAKGGSGKSSLVTAGVSQGLETIGDDFQFLETSQGEVYSHILWSLYHSVKLGPDSPAWPYIDSDAAATPPLPGMEKSLINLLDKFADNVVLSQKVVAILVPALDEQVELTPISQTSALTALLPTSLGMSTRKLESVLALRNLVESVPCYSLTVNRDLDKAITIINRLLSQSSLPVESAT